MTRFEQDYYNDISSIEKSLKRIADALEKGNNKEDKIYYKTRKDMFMDNPCTKEEYEASKQEAHNVKHAFTGLDGKQIDNIPGFEGTLDALDGLTIKSKEQEELDTQHDYLHQLVKNLTMNEYHEFCNEHCLPASDTVAVSNYITDLDYDECLGIISDLEAQNDLSIRYKKNDGPLFWPNCPDLDLRKTARMYTEELEAGINFRNKKECILDYVTNEFGSHGARYTDIIKFAYYLNNVNGPKFGYADRGYYSQGMSGRNPYLIHGGKDFLVKGINKEGDERYFAHSFVESVTEYWKYIK